MYSLTMLIALLYSTLILTLTSSQPCQTTCGSLPIKYPFGTGPGCGDPRFHPLVKCTDQQQLTLSTHTGCYPITSIDYSNQLLTISDPTMSTCQCTRPSRGFGLDWNAPFTFHDSTLFALLGCSNNYNNSTFPTCDSSGQDICGLLSSCNAVSRLNLNIPTATCCVYTPVDLGPSFEMDLGKLQCSSYSAVCGYNGKEYNPEEWEYGIELKYKFNYKNDYPDMCAACEKSNGVCGYDTAGSKPFLCNCPGGLNTTIDCLFGQTWSYGSRVFPSKTGTFFVFAGTVYALAWIIMLGFV